MNYFLTAILLFSLAACGLSQPKKAPKKITGNLQNDIKNLLPAGPITVDLMEGIKLDSSLEVVIFKVQKAMQKDPDWFIQKQNESAATGKRLENDPKLGLTEREFAIFLKYIDENKGVEMTKSGSETINVVYSGNLIKFSGTGRLSLLEDVAINMQNNEAYIGPHTLTFYNTSNVTNANNIFKSKWEGYSWAYTFSNMGKLEDVKSANELKKGIVKKYTITIAVLEKNNKTFVEIVGSEIENGVKRIDVRLPFEF